MQVGNVSGGGFAVPTTAAVANPTRARYRVFSLLFVLASLTYIDRLCISVAAPAISAEFNLSNVQMGYIFSAFTLTYALFEIPSGWLGDRFGTRIALTRIVMWWSAFTILTGATVGFVSLLIVRLLFGAGEAGAIPNSASTVARWFPAAQRGRAMGGVCIGHTVGATLTPPIVLALIAFQGWRWTFVLFGALGFVWCGVWYWWFRDMPEEHSAANEDEISLIRAGAPLAATHSHQVPWGALFSNKNIIFLCAMYFAYGYSLYFYITWLPTYLLNARGFSIASAGFFSSLPWVLGGIAFICGGTITDYLVARGHRKWARSGLGAFGLTMSALMLVIMARAEDNVVSALLIAVALFFQFLTTPAVWATCLDIGRHRSGVVSGTVNTFGNLAGAIASVAFGYILELWGSWTTPFYITAGILVVGVIMWFFINPEHTLDEDIVGVA